MTVFPSNEKGIIIEDIDCNCSRSCSDSCSYSLAFVSAAFLIHVK